MTLRERQEIFALNAAKLIEFIFNQEGYTCTLGEAYRPEVTAQAYAKKGTGIKNSLHTQRLTIDLNIFYKGTYLTNSKAYAFAGEYWESLHPDNAWGGHFNDGNHFSMSYGGRK